jgi:hypothetical protein
MVTAVVGFTGRPALVGANAWIWPFSLMEMTAACASGFKWKPAMYSTLLAEAGHRIFEMCGSDVAETMGVLNALHCAQANADDLGWHAAALVGRSLASMAALQRQQFGDRRGRQRCKAEPARRWRATLSTLSLIAGKRMILSQWTFAARS